MDNRCEQLELIKIIGVLDSLKSDALTIEDANRLLFAPKEVKHLESEGCSKLIIDLVWECCELENIQSLIPDKLESNIIKLKERAIELLKSYNGNDKNMEYPIPTHLKHLLKVDMSKSDSNYLSGSIVCECGCDKFSIQHNENREYDPQIPFDEQDGLKVIVNCKECEKEYVLFDESKHGFNGFVNEDCRTASNDSLKELSCKTCGSRYFFVNVGIEAEDKNQFVEECVNEFPERFTADDYVDSFDWITITLCCANCNESVDWIDLELS